VIDTMNDRKRDVAGVEAEFGVPPRLMVDYQALVGDSVDNVPGVEKVGPKTAVKLLQEYGSLDALVERAHEVKGAVGENLRKALDWLPKGRALLTIKKDCDLKDHIPGLPSLDDIAVSGGQDTEALKGFYDRYGFKGLVKQLEIHDVPPELIEEHKSRKTVGAGPAAAGLFDEPDLSGLSQASNLQYDTILTWPQFDDWLARLEAAGLAAVDTETSSLDEMQAEIIGLSFSVKPGEAAYIPLGHSYGDAPEQAAGRSAGALKSWLGTGQPKLGQHIIRPPCVANHGIEVQGYARPDAAKFSKCTSRRAGESLAEAIWPQRHRLRSIAGKGAHQIPFCQVSVDKAAEYSCEDSDQTLDVPSGAVAQGRRQSAIHLRPGDAAAKALYRVERNGVLIDGPILATSAELGQRMMQLERSALNWRASPSTWARPSRSARSSSTKLACRW
jgi:DNA polymerase-1